MKKVLFCALLLLTACTTEKFETAPEDANVFIVDSAVVYDGGYVVFGLRDVEDDFVVPVSKCLDGVDYPRGTIVVINDDAYVSKIQVDKVPMDCILFVTVVCVIALVVVYPLSRKKGKEK